MYFNGMRIDHGAKPFVIDINKATENNENYRTTLWTGENLQVTLMSLHPGEDIGLEIHPTHDQFLKIKDGQGIMFMGNSKDDLYFEQFVYDDYAIFIPAGMWHNLVNTGKKPLKLYSVYAPTNHPWGTVHPTKKIAEGKDHS